MDKNALYYVNGNYKKLNDIILRVFQYFVHMT